jgi:hypothetical protein
MFKVLVALCAMLYAVSGVAKAAYTKADAIAAVKSRDTDKAYAIVTDAKTPDFVRNYVFPILTTTQQMSLRDTDVYKNNEYVRYSVESRFLNINTGQPRMDELLPYGVSTNRWDVSSHCKYVNKLLKKGDKESVTLAYAESKRLTGMNPLNATHASTITQVIGGVIKGYDMIVEGKGLKESLADMNAYLEAVKSGDAAKIAAIYNNKVPFPSVPDNVLAAVQKKKDENSFTYLLYSGQYDACIARAETLMATSSSQREIESAVRFKAMAINGKAQLPTAANDFLKSLSTSN